jgi:predicted nuclease of predicted toxin-antitoxin system
MRFKIDENLPVEVAVLLQEAGHSAETVYSEGLQGASDAFLIEECRKENRALVTLDLDFGDVRNYPHDHHAGMIILRPRSQDKVSLISLIRRLLVVLQIETTSVTLWIVDERAIRIFDNSLP